jgi:hypothetical protein
MDAKIIPSEEAAGCEPGTIVCSNGELHIRCKDNKKLNVNTFFYQESYIPSYQAAFVGLRKGDKFS